MMLSSRRPHLGREPGQYAVGHALRHEHRPYCDSRRGVPNPPAALITGKPSKHRYRRMTAPMRWHEYPAHVARAVLDPASSSRFTCVVYSTICGAGRSGDGCGWPVHALIPWAVATCAPASCSAFSSLMRARLEVEDDLLHRAGERVGRFGRVGAVDGAGRCRGRCPCRRSRRSARRRSARSGPRRSSRCSRTGTRSAGRRFLPVGVELHRTVTSPVGIGSVETCWYCSTPIIE